MKAKHGWYLLMIVGLLAGLWAVPAGAQQVSTQPEVSTGVAPEGAGIQTLSGSMASFNPDAGGDFCYAPGTVQTFCFLSESYTTDWEYAYDNWFKFPADWEVLDVYDAGPNVCDFGGSWGTFVWYAGEGPYEVDAYTPRYQANPQDHCYTNICFEVNTGTGGDVSWYWDGDGYGSAPHNPCSDDGYTPAGQTACDEMINPVAQIPPCADGIYLTPEHQYGGIAPGECDVFDLSIMNMSGMEEIVDLTYTATGPGTCYGPAVSDPIADDGTWAFQVTVEMDPGAGMGEVVDCEIYAYGQNSGYDDWAWIHAEAMFPGPPAYALDVYPGYNLVYWEDLEIPGAWTPVGSVPQFHPAGDFLGDNYDIMYAFDYDTNEFVSISTADATRTVIGTSVPTGNWTGMTGTADGSTLYASSSVCGTESYLYTIDPATGAATLVGTMRPGSCMIDIAINADGQMYGVDIVDDSLYSIDPATGAATLVGSTGASANYAQGMDFDFATGTLYWAAYTSQGELRILDTGTGMSTLIGAFPGGNEVDCLAIPTGGEPPPEDTMHVQAIDGRFEEPFLVMKVQAVDQDGMALSDVLVDATITMPMGEWARWRYTKPTGWARFWAPLLMNGNYQICVDNLTLPDYTYNPDDNVVTCMDWDW